MVVVYSRNWRRWRSVDGYHAGRTARYLGQLRLGKLRYARGPAALRSVPLRQRERDRADSEKRKQDKRAPKQVRLNRVFNLFFHVFVPLDFWELTEAIRCVYRCAYIVGSTVLAKSARASQDIFKKSENFLGVCNCGLSDTHLRASRLR